MTRNSAALLCVGVAFVIGCVGCMESKPPANSWAIDVQVTDYHWEPLPVTLEVPAGHWLDVTLSFRWGREAGLMDAQPVRKPEEWRVAASMLTEDRQLAEASPFCFQREFPDALEWMGCAYPKGADQITALLGGLGICWLSPEPPHDVQPETRYFWGRIRMPKVPGTYRLVISVFPTATNDRSEPNPFMDQPAEEIYTALIHVPEAVDQPQCEGSGIQRFDPVVYRLLADDLQRR